MKLGPTIDPKSNQRVSTTTRYLARQGKDVFVTYLSDPNHPMGNYGESMMVNETRFNKFSGYYKTTHLDEIHEIII